MSKKSIIINAAIVLSVVLGIGGAYKGYQSNKYNQQIAADEQRVNDMLDWGRK